MYKKQLFVRIFMYFLVFCWLSACKEGNLSRNDEKKHSFEVGNIFDSSKDVDKLYRFISSGNTDSIIPFLQDTSTVLRKIAAMSFGSSLDKRAVSLLINMLNDNIEEVRLAAVFSLGQIKDSTATVSLIQRFANEKSINGKAYILEALGKIGDKQAVSFLLNEPSSIGRSWAWFRYALEHKFNDSIWNAVMADLKHENDSITYITAQILGRIGLPNIRLAEEIIKEISPEIEQNRTFSLLKALSKTRLPQTIALSNKILDSNEYSTLCKIGALIAVQNFDPDSNWVIVKKGLESKNYQLSVQASELVLKHTSKRKLSKIFAMAQVHENARVSGNLFYACFKSDPSFKGIEIVKSKYDSTTSNIEKAFLLKVLSIHEQYLSFAQNEILNTDINAISTNAFEGLLEGYKMYKRPSDFKQLFGLITAKIDIAMLTLFADFVSAQENPMRYVDQKQLQAAIKRMILPRDIEAYYALQKLNNPDFIGNNTANKAIDFERLKKFSSNPKLEINTDKGSFVVELYMNQAPQTVSNFLSLIASGFYHKFVIHRLVPAFVVQDGCNRGDGWGGPDYTIKSEFTPMTYKPGSIGMASAGPNTESSQWFITLAHTPHLDGRYTNFGCVVSGMSVVQQLEVGTTVLTYKILP